MQQDRISKIQYFFVICIFIFTSGCSQISNNKNLLILWSMLSVIYFLFKRANALIEIIRLFSVLLSISALYFFINERIDYQTHLGFYMYIIGAFASTRIAGKQTIYIIVKIVYIAALISLPLYIFQLILPDIFFKINNIFGLPERDNSNSLIFNFTYLHRNRNCGFMWEPGAFAGISIIALYLNMIIVNNIKIINKKNIVLFIAILTTLSTLGYFTLILALLAIVIYRRHYRYLYLFILFLPAIFTFDFLLPKILKESQNLNEELLRTQSATSELQVSVSRSASFLADYSSFIKRPILGYGLDFRTVNAKKIFKEYNENVIRSSGVMNILLKFGLIGLFLYLFLFFKSICHTIDNKQGIIFSLLIFIIIISNPIENSPFTFSLFFLRSINRNNYSRIYLDNKQKNLNEVNSKI